MGSHIKTIRCLWFLKNFFHRAPPQPNGLSSTPRPRNSTQDQDNYKVYLNWANSVLSDCNPPQVVTVDTIRQGKVLCQLIETLWNGTENERLRHWDLVPGSSLAIDYIRAALSHLESRNIKVNFNAEDILIGDIKSILDLLWLLILNYNIHDAGTNQYHQCSVGAGRRNLLAWCQNTLAGLQLDKRCSLVKSLCTNDYFLMLLESTPGLKLPAEDLPTKSQHLIILLENIESQFGIKKDILSVPELIAGTIDEQILMIYLALLKWKIENKQPKPAHQHLWHLTQQTSSAPPPVPPPPPPSSFISLSSSSHSSLEQTRCRQLASQINPSEKQVLPPKQSASIFESSEKDEVREMTSHAALQTSFERSPAAISISSAAPSQSTAAMIDTQAASNQHLRTGDSFALQSDNTESSLEDELRNIHNSVPYRSTVRTQLYARSLTPTITSTSGHQSKSRTDYSDFRQPLSPFSRPRSAMGLTNWTDNYDDSRKIEPNIRSSYSMSKMSSTDQLEKYLNRYESLGSEAFKAQKFNTNPDKIGTPQRKQTTVSEEVTNNINRSQQPSPQLPKHGDDGRYLFKKVIITKDGDGTKIQTVPVSIEEAANFRSSSFTASFQPFALDTTNAERHEQIETNNKEYVNSDWESDQCPPLPSSSPPSSPSLFEMEHFRDIKATGEVALALTGFSKHTPERKVITRQASIDQSSPREEPNNNNNVPTENKPQEIAIRDLDDTDFPNDDALCDTAQPNMAAASVTSKKIDILCIEIGELKKKVMAMETGRTYLTNLNRTLQSTLDSDTKSPKTYKDDQPRKVLDRNLTCKPISANPDISERMNRTWSPSTNSNLLDVDAEYDGNDAINTSLNPPSLNSDFTLSQHPQGVSFENKKMAPSKNSSVNAASENSSKNNKHHLWKVGTRRENFIERGVTVKTTNGSPHSTLLRTPAGKQAEQVDQCVSVDKNQENEEPTETDKKATLENDFAQNADDDIDGGSLSMTSPPKALVGLINGSGDVDELLSRYASGSNLNLDWMFTLMKQLKQENEKLKSRLQQEMVKLQMLSEHLREVQRLRGEDAERAQLEEQEVQEEQALLHQENVDLRERLHMAEELNAELKADVLKLQQYKSEIQTTQRNLRERILRAEKDKKILSEELNLLWRQRKAMRQSNYESSIKNPGMASVEDMNTPPKSRPSLVEAAFSNRLHQTDKKTRSPLTSSPAGQRLSVAPFPISPVVGNNQENQTPDSLFNRHGLGILYPETPKPYRTVSYLEREKNSFSSSKRHSPKSPRRNCVASGLELDQLLDDVEGHSEMNNSIAYDDDDDDDNDDEDVDNGDDNSALQLQKKSRLYWSDENLSRHSESAPNGWVAGDSLERSPRSASDLHLSQTATSTKTGRRRINNVTFNLSNNASNVPSKQKSTLKGILKKASSPTQYNDDGLSNGYTKISNPKNTYAPQRPHYRSSEDIFLEISQQDFFDPPNIRTSDSAKGLLASGMGKKWSSHDSLQEKYSPSARQREFNEFDSNHLLKSQSVNPEDIKFSFSDQMSGNSSNRQQNQQTDPRNHAVFHRLMRENSIEKSPEARPLFGDPNNSTWSFTPYNFYLETLSKQLNDQNRYAEQTKSENVSPSLDAIKTNTNEIVDADMNADPQSEESSIRANSFADNKDIVTNSSEKSTPAKSGSSTDSAGAGRNQKFSGVLSPEQVQFSPTTEAERNAIVCNLCSVFENSDLSLDGSEPGSAKKPRTWYDLDKTPPAQLTDEQRNYANTLIEKYTRLPTEKVQKSAT